MNTIFHIEIGYGTVLYLFVSRSQLAYFMMEGDEILLLTFGNGSVVVLTCKLCIVTIDGTRGMGWLNTKLELSISKLMFLSASVTGGGLEPKTFLIKASCSGSTSVCILYLSKGKSCC